MLNSIGTARITEAATFEHIARGEMGYPRKEKGTRMSDQYCYTLNEELGMKMELISSNIF